MNPTRVRIFYPADPMGVVPGGIDTFIRGIVKFSPADLEFSLVGMTTDSQARPVGRFTRCQLGEREFEFYPTVDVPSAGQRGKVPLSVRYTLATARAKSALVEGFDVFDFHRIEPTLLFLRDPRPKNAFFHQDPKSVRSAQSDMVWKRMPAAYEKLESQVVPRLDSAWCVSEAGVDTLRVRYPQQASSIRFVPTWVDTSVFSAPQPQSRARARHASALEHGIDASAIRIVTVGRLDKQKDPLLMLESFARLVNAGHRVVWLVVGDGVLRPAMQQRVAELGLGSLVRFLGLRSAAEIADILRTCDMFAMSSAYEGMPMAMLEAMACGLPVATTDVGEVRRVVTTGINGSVAAGRSVESFTACLAEVVQRIDRMKGLPAVKAIEPYRPAGVLQPVYENYRRLGEKARAAVSVAVPQAMPVAVRENAPHAVDSVIVTLVQTPVLPEGPRDAGSKRDPQACASASMATDAPAASDAASEAAVVGEPMADKVELAQIVWPVLPADETPAVPALIEFPQHTPATATPSSIDAGPDIAGIMARAKASAEAAASVRSAMLGAQAESKTAVQAGAADPAALTPPATDRPIAPFSNSPSTGFTPHSFGTAARHYHGRRREHVVGAPIDVVGAARAREVILDWAVARESRFVCFCNVHSAVTFRGNPQHADSLQRADLVASDGAPIAWMLRRKGHAGQPRIDGPGTMWTLCGDAESRGIKVGLYGSSPETLQSLRHELNLAFPQLEIAFCQSPPFKALSAEEDQAVCDEIDRAGVGLLFVALGCPKQERWMADHSGRINAVMLGVGAAFDFHAGSITRAPKWMQANGLEWLHRMSSEPGRLWQRYLFTNSVFIARTAGEFAKAGVKRAARKPVRLMKRASAASQWSGSASWPAAGSAAPATRRAAASGEHSKGSRVDLDPHNMTELLARVDASLAARSGRVIGFIASGEGEGTSTLATAYAHTAVTRLSRRVLLLSPHFSEAGKVGVLEAIANGGAVDSAITWHAEGYWTGTLLDEAAGDVGWALSSRTDLWNVMRREFDEIVLDMPSSAASRTGVTMSSYCDGVIVVVEAEKTRAPVAEALVASLQAVRANLLGTVLNKRQFHVPEALYRRL